LKNIQQEKFFFVARGNSPFYVNLRPDFCGSCPFFVKLQKAFEQNP